MLADALRLQIEQYAETMKTENPLYVRAAEGTLTPEHLARYLANIEATVKQSVVHFARARDVSAARGDAVLAAHFDQRIGEEVGHDAWAARDLRRVAPKSERRPAVLPSLRALWEFLESTIDDDPAIYLAYILFGEYLIVLLGPTWLGLLEERCGIPRTSMTVVGNHAELDKDHVQTALEEIDDLVGDPSKLPRMRKVLTETFAHFDRFCAEVTSNEAIRDRIAPLEAVVHLSVA